MVAPVGRPQGLLRQHYLDQFFGSSAFRAELSAFVVPRCETAGWLPIYREARLIGL